MIGFVAMHRTAIDHPLFAGDTSRLGAWMWLVAKACWKPTRFNVGGKTITLERGQYCCSIRDLADAWGWSKSTVDRFLTRLKTETMIETHSGTGRLVITICNYAKYQDMNDDSGTDDGTHSGTAAGQQRDIKEQGNKGTTISSEAKASSDNARAPSGNEQLLPVEGIAVDVASQAIEAWKASAKICGWPIPQKLTPDRRKKLSARLREHGIDGWLAAIDRATRSNMLGRDPPRWWDFDFLIRSHDQIVKVLEGKYDEQFGASGAAKSRPPGIGRTEAAAAGAMDDIVRIFASATASSRGREGSSERHGRETDAGDSRTVLGPSDAVPDAMRRVGNGY